MRRDWDMIEGDPGSEGIKPERGDGYPDGWIGGADFIGRPIGFELDI